MNFTAQNYLKFVLALLLYISNLGYVFGQTQTPDSSLVETNLRDSIINNLQQKEIDTSIVDPPFITFFKSQDTKSADSLIFNILKIKNITNEPIKGSIEILLPKDWSVSGFNSNVVINLQPGEEASFPYFVSLSSNVIGGTTYLLTGRFINEKTSIAEVGYSAITIKKKPNWNLVVPKTKIYFDVNSRYADAQIILKNSGNTIENIYVKFSMDQNIRVKNFVFPEDEIFVTLKPKADTTINIQVSLDESNEFSNQSNNGNYLKIKAQNGKEKYSNISFARLPSSFENPLSKSLYPLEVSLFATNIMTEGNPIYQLSARGNQLYCDDKSLDYALNFRGVNFRNRLPGLTYGEQMYQFSSVRINYKTPHYRISLGDVGTNFDLGHSGRGVELEYKRKSTSIIGSASLNTRFPIAVYSGLFKTKVKSISIIAGATYQQDQFNRINSFNYGASVGLRFLKYHSITSRVALSQRNNYYQIGDFNGQEVLPNSNTSGYMARFGYAFTKKRLNLDLSAMQSSPNHIGSTNNSSQYTGNLNYTLAKKTSVAFNGGILNFNQRIFYQGGIIPVQQFNSKYLNLLFNQNLNLKTKVSAGGRYTNSIVYAFYSSLGGSYPNESNNYNLQLRIGHKFNYKTSISLSGLRGFYQIVDFYSGPILSASGFDPNKLYPNSRFTINFRNNQNGISASFQNGIFSPNQLQLIPTFGENQTIQISPYLNKTFFDGKLLLKSYNTILFQTVTKTESYNLNAAPWVFLKNGWTLNSNVTYRILSRENNETGNSTSRNFFVTAGVTKRFDFQQPCIKYYDLTVVYFKDLNGNLIKDENEPYVDNIISRIRKVSEFAIPDSAQEGLTQASSNSRLGQFIELEMISSRKGTIEYKNIPEGSYVLSTFPLNRLKDVYNLNGPEQKIDIYGNTTLYVPYSESYKVSGRVIVELQEFSSFSGKPDLSSIGVIAIDEDGNNFKTITDQNGYFSISVPPKNGVYDIKINNIFGPPLQLEQNCFKVEFSSFKSYEINFIYKEKERKINSEGGYDFSLLNKKPENPSPSKPTKKLKEEPESEKVKPTLNSNAEKKLWEKTDDLQKQIDELRKLKEELQDIQTQQKQTLEEINQAKDELEKVKEETQKVQEQQKTQPAVSQPNPINATAPEQTNTPVNTDNSNLDELDELIDQLIEKTNPTVNYRVEFGVFKEKMPINFLNQLIKFGNVEVSDGEGGESRFISKPYYSKKEADDYANYLKQQNIGDIRLVGEKDGKEVPVEEVDQLLNK
jgi:hypothetical protein